MDKFTNKYATSPYTPSVPSYYSTNGGTSSIGSSNWFTSTLKGAASSLVGGIPGALLGVGSSILGGLFSNKKNRDNALMQQQWQEKMNLQQQEWQERMWNMTNEYNTPSNQMQRLVEAGINPNNAVGGLGTQTANMAQQPQIPSANPIPGMQLDLANAVTQGMAANKEMQLMDAQRENIESQTAKNLKDVDALGSQMKLWEKEGQLMDIDILNKPLQYKATIEQINALRDKYVADMHLSEEEASRLDYLIKEIMPIEKALAAAKVKLTNQEVQESVARAAQCFAAAALSYEQVKTEKSKQDLMQSQTTGQRIENTIRGIDAMFEFGDKLLNRKMTAEQIKHLQFTNAELEYAKDFLSKNGVPMEILNSPVLPEFIKLGLLANVSGFGGNAEPISNLTYMYNQGEKMNDVLSGAFQIVGAAMGATASGVGVAVGASAARHIPGALPQETRVRGFGYSTSTTWNPRW